MIGVDSDIGMTVRFCLVTGLPAEESKFNCTLRRISPELADIMTEEYEAVPQCSSMKL